MNNNSFDINLFCIITSSSSPYENRMCEFFRTTLYFLHCLHIMSNIAELFIFYSVGCVWSYTKKQLSVSSVYHGFVVSNETCYVSNYLKYLLISEEMPNSDKWPIAGSKFRTTGICWDRVDGTDLMPERWRSHRSIGCRVSCGADGSDRWPGSVQGPSRFLAVRCLARTWPFGTLLHISYESPLGFGTARHGSR